MAENRRRWFLSPLSRQYIVWTFLFGAIVTLVMTVADIGRFYDSAKLNTTLELKSLLNVYSGPLGRAVWEFNLPQIDDTLYGLVHSTLVERAELRAETIEVGIGEHPANPLAESIQIKFEFEGEMRELGSVTLIADTQRLNEQTIWFGIYRLGSNALRSLLLVIFTYFVFNRLVNRHLVSIARQSSGQTFLRRDASPYSLDRDDFAYSGGDELDSVVIALNSMQEEISDQFGALEKLARSRQKELVSMGQILRTLNFHVSFFREDGSPLLTSFLPTDNDHAIAELLPQMATDNMAAQAMAQSAGFAAQTIFVPNVRGLDNTVLYQLELTQDSGICWHMSGVRLNDGTIAILYADYSAVHGMRRQLERARKMEALGSLVGSVSHEFKNILAILRGNVDIMASLELSDQRVAKRLNAMQSTIKRGSDVIDRLISPEQRREDAGDVRLAVLFANLRELVEPLLPPKIVFETSYADDVALAVPLKELEMSLVNLAKNALEAIGDVGRIRISIQKVRDAEVPGFDGKSTAGYVEIEVMDTGPGIPVNDQIRIFEPFFTTKVTGAGLGLWSVYDFCRQHGGTITYRPPGNWDHGAFLLYLPVSDGHEMADERVLRLVMPQHGLAGSRLLIVDDEVELLDVMRDFFHGMNSDVTCAQSVQEARDALDDGEFDIVICDYSLPDGNGLEIVAEVAECHPLSKTVVISGNIPNIDFSKSVPVDRVYAKPVNLSALAAGLNELLSPAEISRQN